MKKSDIRDPIVSVILAFIAFGGFLPSAQAVTLYTKSLNSGTHRGIDADNGKIQCSFNMGSIRRSPSNKGYRSITFSHNGNTWKLIDFEPRDRLPLIHYNQQGHYGYDVWSRSYTDEQYFVRIWMNYLSSKRVPASVELYSMSKKTSITRLLGDCTQLR